MAKMKPFSHAERRADAAHLIAHLDKQILSIVIVIAAAGASGMHTDQLRA
jgi:hypothetical protein